MPKKTVKKTTNPTDSKTTAKQAGKDYPLPKQNLDEQQRQVRKAAAAGAKVLKFPSPPATQLPAAEPTFPAKPLTTLERLWPSNAAPKGQSNGPDARALQGQKASGSATAPKASLVQSAPTTTPETKSVAAQAPKPTSPKLASVTFALSKAGAKRVSLCGEFNGWSPSATPLKRHDDGHWETTVALSPGQYQYKFLVDGEWLPDPAAQKNVRNEYGWLNSVLEVRA